MILLVILHFTEENAFDGSIKKLFLLLMLRLQSAKLYHKCPTFYPMAVCRKEAGSFYMERNTLVNEMLAWYPCYLVIWPALTTGTVSQKQPGVMCFVYRNSVALQCYV